MHYEMHPVALLMLSLTCTQGTQCWTLPETGSSLTFIFEINFQDLNVSGFCREVGKKMKF